MISFFSLLEHCLRICIDFTPPRLLGKLTQLRCLETDRNRRRMEVISIGHAVGATMVTSGLLYRGPQQPLPLRTSIALVTWTPSSFFTTSDPAVFTVVDPSVLLCRESQQLLSMSKPTAIAATMDRCSFTHEGPTVFAFGESSCLSYHPPGASPATATVDALFLEHSVVSTCVSQPASAPATSPGSHSCVCARGQLLQQYVHTKLWPQYLFPSLHTCPQLALAATHMHSTCPSSCCLLRCVHHWTQMG